MANFYGTYPGSGGSGAVPTYANLAAFPSAVTAGNGALAIALDTDILYISNGTTWEVLADPAHTGGDVVGPASATDNAITRFDGTTGKLIQNSGAILDDSNNITGLANITATGALLSGLTASRATQTDASKNLQSSVVTTTELAFLSGTTSAVQTQLNGMLKLAGRAGGQTADGGTAASENLALSSTAHATKGKIYLGLTSAFDEVNTRLGIGTDSPLGPLSIVGSSGSTSNSTMASLGGTQWRMQITGGDEANAGVLDYRSFDPNSFNIVGAGASAGTRNLRIFDTLSVGASGPSVGVATFNGAVGLGTTAPSTMLQLVRTSDFNPALGVNGCMITGGDGTSLGTQQIWFGSTAALGGTSPYLTFLLNGGGNVNALTANIVGVHDLFYQMIPQANTGFGIIEAYSALGLIFNCFDFTGAAGYIAFCPQRVEAMRIDKNNNVLIGTTTALALLTVAGTANISSTVTLGSLTASRAVATDGSKNLVSSATTATELGYVNGVTSAIQTQLNAKASSTLTSAHLFVGNGSNVATDVAASGDLTLANTGAFTIANLAVTNAKIANSTIDLTAKVTGALPLVNGGTGTAAASANAAFNALSPLTTKGDIVTFSTVNARLPVGSDGQVLTADSAQTLGVKWGSTLTNPMTTLGDIIYEDATPTPARLAGNITSTKKFLTQTGTGAISAVPGWNTIVAGDLPIVTQSAAGAVTSAGQLLGTNTNDSASSGNVGEYLESKTTTLTNAPSSNTYGDMTSLSITAGDWDVTLGVWTTANGATATEFDIGISTTSGNSSTGLEEANNKQTSIGPNATHNQGCIISSYRVSLSATTTHYAKLRFQYTVATPQYCYRFSARRVR